MASWFGHAKLSFTHSPNPVSLPTKKGNKTPLSKFIKSTTPPCQLNPLLFNGHLQTFWTAVKSSDIPIIYKRKIFEAENPAYAGQFAVDFVVHENSDPDPSLPERTTYYSDEEWKALEAGSDDNKPMLICLHGLSGGSHEVYLRHVLAPLMLSSELGGKQKKDVKWEACVVNSRGCAQSKITTSVLYNARATWDIRQMVKWFRKKFPNRPLFAVGYSLGANILTNYVGEEGPDCELNAAVVVSNPWALEVSSIFLQRSWVGLNIYSKTMGTNMRKLFETHVEQISKNSGIDVEKVRSAKYLHEFDRYVQGPTWGYPTEGAYYRDASSVDSILAIRIPFLAINAEDDPISHREAIPYEEFKQNPYTVLCTTSLGGHLSWFQIGGSRWFTKPVTNFFNKMVDDINMEGISKPVGHADMDGMVEPADAKGPHFHAMRRKMHIPVQRA